MKHSAKDLALCSEHKILLFLRLKKNVLSAMLKPGLFHPGQDFDFLGFFNLQGVRCGSSHLPFIHDWFENMIFRVNVTHRFFFIFYASVNGLYKMSISVKLETKYEKIMPTYFIICYEIF